MPTKNPTAKQSEKWKTLFFHISFLFNP
ncbi:unnamed protein product [Spirodela intermedia]|uniref:Uncharacterized protein n=1 Tax=Spirodela intermedia TaxID=51605 RepID=A0A7I8KM51_SPIIN|nr:unnamed protein product [Spirodela intermedia]